jgi:hypothetical protein
MQPDNRKTKTTILLKNPKNASTLRRGSGQARLSMNGRILPDFNPCSVRPEAVEG